MEVMQSLLFDAVVRKTGARGTLETIIEPGFQGHIPVQFLRQRVEAGEPFS